jgi:hypothetical protein
MDVTTSGVSLVCFVESIRFIRALTTVETLGVANTLLDRWPQIGQSTDSGAVPIGRGTSNDRSVPHTYW